MAQGWGAHRTAHASRFGGLWFRRGIVSLLALGLAAWLGWLLVRPLLHPRTHLVLLAGDVLSGGAAIDGVPADYVVEDFRALLSLDAALDRDIGRGPLPLILGSLRSPGEMQPFADRLNDQITGRHDVLILYVSAHGLTQDGDAWLLASGADPQSPLGGRYRLASLLAQLRECKAATKVLLLDAGRIEYDPLRGLLENDFPTRLIEQVEELGDPALWVLVSHAAGQRSHLSPALRQSVFGYFIATGLKGAADANGDRTVHWGELSRFVVAGVSGWVRQTSGGTAEQTPLLAWGGGDLTSATQPTLLAVTRRAEAVATNVDQKLDHAKSIEQAQQPAAKESEAAERGSRELDSLISRGLARSTPSGRLGHFASDAARKAVSKATGGAKLPGESKGATAAGEPAAADDKTAEKAAEPAATDEKGKAANGKETSGKEPAGDAAAKKNGGDAANGSDKAKVASGKSSKTESSVEIDAQAARERLARELQRAWRLRDELASPDRLAARPVDYAPHLWREVEQQLLAIDRKLRTGYAMRWAAIEDQLRPLLDSLDSLAAGQPPEAMPAGSLGRRIAELQPGRALDRVEPSSLAFAELVAREGGRPLPAELAPAVAALDRLIATGDRGDLERFAAELKPEHDRWAELRLARRLAERPDLDWRPIHLLLEATRLGEQAAAGYFAAGPWIAADIERADSLRDAAEHELLGGAKLDRDALLAQLTAARDAYKLALTDVALVRSAQRLANDIWLRLPDYLAWNAAAAGAASVGPTDSELLALMDKLAELNAALATRDAGKTTAIREAAAQLIAARTTVEQAAAPLAIEELLGAPAAAGEVWQMELLLETPLPGAELRQALTAMIGDVDAAVASQVKTADSAAERANPPADADELRFAARAQLLRRQWGLGLAGLTTTDYETFAKTQLEVTAASARSDEPDVASLRSRCDLLSSRLHDLLHNLPADIVRGVETDLDLSSPASRPSRLDRLRAWSRAVRLVDPRLENAGGEARLSSSLANAAAYDQLAWQSNRAARAAEDAPPREASYLYKIVAVYRAAAAAIPRQPELPGGQKLPLELTGPARIALTYLTQKEAEFAVRNTGSQRLKAWVAIEGDEQFVQATSAVDRSVYAWSDLIATDAAGQLTTVEQRAVRLPATLEIAPGQTLKLPLRLVRRRPSPHASHLVLRIISREGIARHDLTIDLPPPEDIALSMAGPVARWSPLPAGVELLPFPNRTAFFTVELANGQPQERKVDVEVSAIESLPPQGIPSVPLSAADAARLRSEMRVGPTVAEAKAVVLPGGGEPVALELTKPELAPPPLPATAKAAAGAPPADSAAAKLPASGKPPPPPLPHGLLVAITDLVDKRQTFRQLTISPQRPQRYVKAQVRYRAERERIEIRISPQGGSLLPADGVRIHGEIAEPLPAESERQLDAVLKPGQGEAEMYVEVPSSPDQAVTLRLTVDDDPRAMIFRVPTSGETSDVPESLDLLAVRVAGLPEGTIYKPPTASIPVQLAIDAPASALKNPPLRVSVGLDQNRDRELRGDDTVLLTNDRQVTAALAGIGKAGDLQIATTVGDIAVDVPAAAIVGGRVNVLAHAVLGDKEAWSEPVEIVIDGQPPRVSAIELRPAGTAIIGKPVLVSALADDLGLSGVAQVEAAFDTDRSGKFGPATKPVAGALGDDGRWSASIPTAGLAGGSYNLLVRAIDKAGNKGEPARAAIRLLAEGDVEADARKNLAADIIGTVSYGAEPQAGVTVNLVRDMGAPPPTSKAKSKVKSPAPPPLAQTVTDASGQFKFPKVAPGKYFVIAEGLVRNKNRTAEAPIAFARPAEVQPVMLSLK